MATMCCECSREAGMVVLDQVSDGHAVRGQSAAAEAGESDGAADWQVQHHRAAVDPADAVSLVQRGLEL